MRYASSLSTERQGDFPDDESSSTKFSVPDSEKELGDYKKHLPNVHGGASYGPDPGMGEANSNTAESLRTHNFYRCLAYRFGVATNTLEARFGEMQEKLTPEQKEKNRDFLETIIGFWDDDASRRPNDPRKNRDQFGSERITPAWSDIVETADPDNYKEEWGSDGPAGKGSDPREACDLISKGLLREAWESKTLAYSARHMPVRDEYGHDDSVWAVGDPLWTFARERSPGKRWWDINRWPMYLQSEQTQQKIKASGPQKQPPTTAEAPPEPRPAPPAPFAAAKEGEGLLPHQMELCIPYSEHTQSRRKFWPGVTEFWLGDTPLQQKVFEDRMRKRKSPLPPPP